MTDSSPSLSSSVSSPGTQITAQRDHTSEIIFDPETQMPLAPSLVGWGGGGPAGFGRGRGVGLGRGREPVG